MGRDTMDRGDECDVQRKVSYQEPRTLVEFKQSRLSLLSALILHPVESPYLPYRSNPQVRALSALWGALIRAGGGASSPD